MTSYDETYKDKLPCPNCGSRTYFLTYNLIKQLVLECTTCGYMRSVVNVERSLSRPAKNLLHPRRKKDKEE